MLKRNMIKDLTVGDSRKTLWLYCLPLLGSVFFQQLYNLADTVIAGKFIGELALASVGNASEITLFYLAFAMGCNIGCSVITSQLFGAKNYSGVKSAVSTSIISFTVLCLILMLFGFTCSRPILTLINTPDSIMESSMLYLNIYTSGLIFIFLYNISNGIFSALGDTLTPFIFLVFSSVSNIFVDILFVTTFNMGIAGVAWATFICQGLSCVLSLLVLFIRLKKIKVDEKIKIFSFPLFKKLCVVAIPSIIQQSCISIGNIVIQGVINIFGEFVIAGYTAAIKLVNIATNTFMAMASGVSAFVSQNIGAKKLEKVKDAFKYGNVLNFILAIILFLIYFIFAREVIGIFLDSNASEETYKTGITMMRIISPFFLIICIKITADGILRGAGAMKLFMTTTFSDLLARVIFVYIFAYKVSIDAIWFSWAIGWGIGTAFGLVFYYTGMWKKNIIRLDNIEN